MNCLDLENGLADHLYDKNIIELDICVELNEMIQYDSQNRKFLHLLSKKINEKYYNEFLEALKDTDQLHVVNLLEGRFSNMFNRSVYLLRKVKYVVCI